MDVTEKTIHMVKKLLNGSQIFKGQYSMPYSTNDDDKVDYIIKYRIDRVVMWKSKTGNCFFEGTIYIEPLQISLGFNNDWEYGFKQHDISESIWDEMEETIISRVYKHLPHVCLDCSFDFATLNNSRRTRQNS